MTTDDVLYLEVCLMGAVMLDLQLRSDVFCVLAPMWDPVIRLHRLSGEE